jgi:hypothetical protein
LAFNANDPLVPVQLAPALGSLTVTVVDAWAVPPGPLQLNVNVESVVSVPVLWVPLVDWVPDQLPEAVHEVASEEDHVNVDAPPVETIFGLAPSVIAGAAATEFCTVTVAD